MVVEDRAVLPSAASRGCAGQRHRSGRSVGVRRTGPDGFTVAPGPASRRIAER
jgi:hypothetical protein